MEHVISMETSKGQDQSILNETNQNQSIIVNAESPSTKVESAFKTVRKSSPAVSQILIESVTEKSPSTKVESAVKTVSKSSPAVGQILIESVIEKEMEVNNERVQKRKIFEFKPPPVEFNSIDLEPKETFPKNELEISNEYGADRTSKAVRYLRSILHDEDLEINKNNPQKVSCPKVPPILRNKERSKDNYDPRIVSLGPYHHGKAELQAAQTIKTMFMQQILSENGKSIEELYIKVLELNQHTRSCYVVGSTKDYGDEAFALMMLQDGCFILCLIESMTSRLQKEEELMTSRKTDYIPMIIYHLGLFEAQYLYQDILLLENQIPFRVLNVLISNIFKETDGLEMVKSFINFTQWGKFLKEDTPDENKEPVHLLGLVKSQISKRGHHEETKLGNEDIDFTRYLPSFGSVSDLRAKGINIKPSNSISLLSTLLKGKPKSISLRDVDFKSHFFFTGELKLPPLFLDSDSQIFYLNLIAHELCSSSDCIVMSYISFMSSLIANPEDVKALRSERIILHTLSSDKEVFKMLKEISATNLQQNYLIYQGVREKIEKHCKNKIKIWMAEGRHKYFSQPWSLISLFAAVFVIILTFLQTFYTINPRKA